MAVSVANDDAEGAPDADMLAELDAAGETVVRLLAALAVDHPAAARRFADQHGHRLVVVKAMWWNAGAQALLPQALAGVEAFL